MDFLGIGSGELLVILIVALIFVGPEKMVGAARTLGKLARQISQAGKDFTQKLEEEVDLQAEGKELRKAGQEVSNVLRERLSIEPRPQTTTIQSPAQKRENSSDGRTSPGQTDKRE